MTSSDAHISCACPPLWPVEHVGRHHPKCPARPIPAGTLCTLAGAKVRVYATIEVGALWDGTYRCIDGERKSHGLATRDQLDAIGGVQ